MWVTTDEGFYSIVKDQRSSKREDRLLIRARVHTDLERAKEWFDKLDPDTEYFIRFNPNADYCYRMSVPRTLAQEWIDTAMERIDYPNFKDRVTETQGKARHNVYTKVWSDLLALEDLEDRMG